MNFAHPARAPNNLPLGATLTGARKGLDRKRLNLYYDATLMARISSGMSAISDLLSMDEEEDPL